MKYIGEEINIFEDGYEKTLSEWVSKFYVIKKYFVENRLPPLERDYIKIFKEKYNIELSIEEMIEFRNFCEEDWPEIVNSNIRSDFENGMEIVDIRRLFG